MSRQAALIVIERETLKMPISRNSVQKVIEVKHDKMVAATHIRVYSETACSIRHRR